MRSFNPMTKEKVWEGSETSSKEISQKIHKARQAFLKWSQTSLDERIKVLEEYASNVTKHQPEIAELISKETGKPLWEAKTEVTSMAQKVPISIQAYKERCHEKTQTIGQQQLVTRFKPHGVVIVLGPFNFPGHLPNGHIVPALLAGNAVIFKPSELAPGVGEKLVECFYATSLPKDVLQIVQGGRSTGEQLVSEPDIDGIFFTGSAPTGTSLNEKLAQYPGKILALEMGGNNPLVVSQITDISAAVYATIQSAFLTSGQRCSCARRLILVESANQNSYLTALVKVAQNLNVGAYTDQPEPFMGPVINMKAADRLLQAQEKYITAGAKPLLTMKLKNANQPLLTPGILDVTHSQLQEDEEYFGPLLQLTIVPHFEAAIKEANRTSYGLTAGLLSESFEEWQHFIRTIRAGVINWNAPTTGASSQAPFGGIGKSGNHRPSAYLAADYCSYPVASQQSDQLQLPISLLPGVHL